MSLIFFVDSFGWISTGSLTFEGLSVLCLDIRVHLINHHKDSLTFQKLRPEGSYLLDWLCLKRMKKCAKFQKGNTRFLYVFNKLSFHFKTYLGFDGEFCRDQTVN